MNAMSRDLAGAPIDETIAYGPGPDGSRGGDSADASPAAPRGQYRYTFASGARPLDGYTIKRAIGRGGFGEVYYATSDAGKEVALKLITRNLDVERRGVQQCMNLKSHHLITVFDIKANDAGDSFVIMEYIAGPSLAQILAQHPTGLPPQEVRFWLKGLVEGVSYLHDHGIVHRDLKPANLFLEEGVVKIGDYGLSKAISHSQEPGHSESVGTCHYMAPEIASGKYHRPIDVYAIGVILYELITGRVPFDGECVGEVLMKHLTAQPDLSPLSEPYKSIVRMALAKDPNHRPARVIDLLPKEDVPQAAPLRFIGDGKSSAPHDPAPAPVRPAPPEEIHRIEAEEPVFYIGPDTVPPRPRSYRQPGGGGWAWLNTPWTKAQGKIRRAVATRPAPARRPQQQPAAPPRVQPRPAPIAPPPVRPPEPAPEPPILPSGRVRLAELTGSMLMSAPVAALGAAVCLPLYHALSIPLPPDPKQLAYLFLMTLLGTWAILVPTKLWEGRSVPYLSRRLTFAVLGLALGAVGVGLAGWTHLRPSPMGDVRGFDADLVSWARQVVPAGTNHDPAAFIGYFGLALAANGWWKATDRGRWRRFRPISTIKAGATAGLLGLLWPSPQPWATVVVTLIAITTQVVSPWNRQAAEYGAWAARRKPSRAAA